jgi:STE24 endopeptidase
LALNLLSVTLTLFVASRFIDSTPLSLALGASDQVVALNLIAFTLLYGPISTLIGALGNTLSRRFEYQADAFAAQTSTPDAIANALARMVGNDYGSVTAHPLYTFLNLTHPAPVDRIRAIRALERS